MIQDMTSKEEDELNRQVKSRSQGGGSSSLSSPTTRVPPSGSLPSSSSNSITSTIQTWCSLPEPASDLIPK